MDINDLNKSQLILLAILLSFITSIATGITTVTLMEQAPSSVTVPINRVIQNTVEKIVQVPGNTTTNTVVVKEEDLVVDAIDKNQSAIFSISRDGQDFDGNPTEVPLGKGFAVSKDGLVVVDGSTVFNGSTLYVKNSSGKFKATFLKLDNAGFAFLKVGEPVDPASKLAFTVPTFGDLNKMKIGQKVLVFGANLSSFIFDGNKDFKLTVTKTNAGGVVLNLDGEALGIALSSETNSFASINAISESLKTASVQ